MSKEARQGFSLKKLNSGSNPLFYEILINKNASFVEIHLKPHIFKIAERISTKPNSFAMFDEKHKRKNIEKRSFFENGGGVRLGVAHHTHSIPLHFFHSLIFSSLPLSFSTHILSPLIKNRGAKPLPISNQQLKTLLFSKSQSEYPHQI